MYRSSSILDKMKIIWTLKYILFEILSKVDKNRYQERQKPIHVSFCIHAEKIYDKHVFIRLVDFVKYYKDTTGKLITLCAFTPISHEIKYGPQRPKVDEYVYAKRIEKLKKDCIIGYHGHFYTKEGMDYIPVRSNNFDKDLVFEQMEREIEWFNEHKIVPKRYSAGWWFLNKDILIKLQQCGFILDFSIRHNRTNTFGEVLGCKDKIPPVGNVFSTLESHSLLEIQSVYYPCVHPYRIRKLLIPFVKSDTDTEMHFCFPLHDWDIMTHKREIMSNIKSITTDIDYMHWTDISSEEIDEIRKTRKIVEI